MTFLASYIKSLNTSEAFAARYGDIMAAQDDLLLWKQGYVLPFQLPYNFDPSLS